MGNPVRAWLAGVQPVSVEGAAPIVPSDHVAVVVDLVTEPPQASH